MSRFLELYKVEWSKIKNTEGYNLHIILISIFSVLVVSLLCLVEFGKYEESRKELLQGRKKLHEDMKGIDINFDEED